MHKSGLVPIFTFFFSRALEAGEETRLITMLTAAEKAAGKLPVSS